MSKLIPLCIAMLCIGITACSSDSMSVEEHEQYIVEWHENRLERLQQRQGWLSLAGMEWLDEGEHTFGSDRSNDVIFPPGDMPRFAGNITRNGEKVHLNPSGEADILYNNQAFDGGEVYNPDDGAKMLTVGSVDFLIIQRSELIGVRIYDLNSPYRVGFTGVDLKPIDMKWRVSARFVENEDDTRIAVSNVLGQTNNLRTPGTLFFELDGQEYNLDVLPASDSFFVIVGDESNRSSTYGGGRYLYTDLPDENGNVIMDFNKLYNPPCAFTPYSTCNLPPPQNRLDVYIDAGEKKYELPAMTASVISD